MDGDFLTLVGSDLARLSRARTTSGNGMSRGPSLDLGPSERRSSLEGTSPFLTSPVLSSSVPTQSFLQERTSAPSLSSAREIPVPKISAGQNFAMQFSRSFKLAASPVFQ